MAERLIPFVSLMLFEGASCFQKGSHSIAEEHLDYPGTIEAMDLLFDFRKSTRRGCRVVLFCIKKAVSFEGVWWNIDFTVPKGHLV